MTDKIEKSIFSSIINSKTIIFMIAYIAIGALFTSFQFASENWTCLFLDIITNKIYLTIFIFPTTLLLTIISYKYIAVNYSILIRFHNRKRFIKYQIVIALRTISFFYMITLIVIGIMTNITPHYGEIISKNLNYNTYDIVILIISIIKIYFSLSTLTLLSLVFLNKTNNEKYTIAIMFLIFIMIFLNTRIYFKNTLYYLNPNLHIYNTSGFNNVYISIISSVVYYSLCLFFSFLLLKRIVLNMKEIGEFKSV